MAVGPFVHITPPPTIAHTPKTYGIIPLIGK